MRWGWIGAAAALAACGGSAGSAQTADDAANADAGPSECAPRNGVYLIDFTERSGNCGELSEQIVQSTDTLAAGCTGSTADSTNNCDVTIQTTCPLGTTGDTVQTIGVATWDASGSSASALLEITEYGTDGVAICSSTYNAAYTQQ